MEELSSIQLSSMAPYELTMDQQPTPDPTDSKKKRRPPNSFLLFCKEKRPAARNQNPQLKNVEISKILSDDWKNLPESEKKRYKMISAEQQKSFKQENPDYKYEKAKLKRLTQKQKNEPDQKMIKDVLEVKTLLSMPPEEAKSYIFYLSQQINLPQVAVPDPLQAPFQEQYGEQTAYQHDVFQHQTQ